MRKLKVGDKVIVKNFKDVHFEQDDYDPGLIKEMACFISETVTIRSIRPNDGRTKGNVITIIEDRHRWVWTDKCFKLANIDHGLTKAL